MITEVLERKRVITQRKIRRLRQQRLLHHRRSLNGENTVSTSGAHPKKLLLVKDLGWTAQEAANNHARLRNFARFWEGPGMAEYDLI